MPLIKICRLKTLKFGVTPMIARRTCVESVGFISTSTCLLKGSMQRMSQIHICSLSYGFPQLSVCKSPEIQDSSPFHLCTDDPMAHHVRQRPINVDVSSNDCFDMAMGWVRTCLQTYSRCLSDSEKALPTRVIDVGNSNTSKSLFLLISQGGRGR
jgi:hypothetical protein